MRSSPRRTWWTLALAGMLLSAAAQAQTTLTTGDIGIVGVAACPGSNDDQISFFCMKDITTGTTIDLTDNGYERGYACGTQPQGTFGNTEGAVRMTRTGGTILKGTVITFQMTNTTTISSIAPDAAWSCTVLNFAGTQIDLNNNGDQVIFMQGGTWSAGTTNQHNATYSGRFIAGVSTQNPPNSWTAQCTNGTQYSNPPPGVGCLAFRMSSATAWDKYIGPLTAATPKDWLFRIADPLNWSSYANCAAYGAAAPNWTTAPVLTILTPASTTNGLWTGNKGTDWFNICNWDDLQVPTNTTNVVINENAVGPCVVGASAYVSAATNATCQSLTLSSDNPVNNTLTVNAGRTLTVNNNLTVTKTAPGTGILGVYLSSGTLTSGNVILTGTTAGAQNAVFQNLVSLNTLTVNGNLTINNGGLLDLQPVSGTGGTLNLTGNWINNGSEADFRDANSTVRFAGLSNSSLTTNAFEERFGTLVMNKTTGNLILNNPISIRTALNWTSNGALMSSSSALLSMEAGSTTSGAASSRFVSGPVRKYGNTDFTFPIGKGTAYRPAQVTGITNATSGYTAEYFPASPQSTFGNSREATLHHISDCEYWNVTRTSGSDDPYVWLSWDSPNSCGVTLIADMRVAYWNGSQWLNRGAGSLTGNTTSGTVRTEDLQSAFGNWTLASVSAQNPLPIQLVAFDAQPEAADVLCTWTTASERDNDHFTVERSTDVVHFDAIGTVPGAGDSQEMLSYRFMDLAPVQGLSYYRLRQTDHDGTTTVSNAVPVYMKQGLGLTVTSAGWLVHDLPVGSTYQVLDPSGRVIVNGRVPATAFQLPIDGLAKGVYIVRLTDGIQVRTTRFVP